MFGTRVTAATEEIKHFRWCSTENQLSVAQNGNFIKELMRKSMALVCIRSPYPLENKFPSSQSLLIPAMHQDSYCGHWRHTEHVPIFLSLHCQCASCCIWPGPSITSGVEKNSWTWPVVLGLIKDQPCS